MSEAEVKGKQAFLDDLGVRAEDTAHVEHRVLQKVQCSTALEQSGLLSTFRTYIQGFAGRKGSAKNK